MRKGGRAKEEEEVVTKAKISLQGLMRRHERKWQNKNIRLISGSLYFYKILKMYCVNLNLILFCLQAFRQYDFLQYVLPTVGSTDPNIITQLVNIFFKLCIDSPPAAVSDINLWAGPWVTNWQSCERMRCRSHNYTLFGFFSVIWFLIWFYLNLKNAQFRSKHLVSSQRRTEGLRASAPDTQERRRQRHVFSGI